MPRLRPPTRSPAAKAVCISRIGELDLVVGQGALDDAAGDDLDHAGDRVDHHQDAVGRRHERGVEPNGVVARVAVGPDR